MSTVKVQTQDDVSYDVFSKRIREHFSSFANGPIFTTSAVGLFEAFLNGLPAEYRQHYTCHACRDFVETFGGLVSISSSGKIKSVMWPTKVPNLFKGSVASMLKIIDSTTVKGVFLHGKQIWGTPVTGEWNHMSVVDAPAFHHSLKTSRQMMAEKVEDYGMLWRSLAEFKQDTVEQSIAVLQSGSVYRGDRFLGIAEWFLGLKKSLSSTKHTKARDNLVWLAVATAPSGYCHIRGTMIGTLLDDLVSGYTLEAVVARFSAKTDSSQYQRAQTAPTVGNIEQAEKVVERLGLKNSLQRRYMSLEEIPQFVWRPPMAKPVSAGSGGIFSGLSTKEKASIPDPFRDLPPAIMTWRKFSEKVLPTATKIEVMVGDPTRFAALVTAVHPDSPSIFQWSNPVSWYYHGGVDAEMRRRVEDAGGQYYGCEIRASLSWNTYTDLDLHCEGPCGHIFYGSKRDGFGGWLDVDANGGAPITIEPVENIRWVNAPVGHYTFYVHNFSERSSKPNRYNAELEIAGKLFHFEGELYRTNSKADLISFHYQKGVVPPIRGVAKDAVSAWGLDTNRFYPVAGIVKSPNLWGDHPVEHAGDHTFFLIEGCKDIEQGKGRGFFNEMLKPDLREIRKTLEAYTASTPIETGDGSPACGLGFSKDADWGVTLRVTSGSITSTYKIDRLD